MATSVKPPRDAAGRDNNTCAGPPSTDFTRAREPALVAGICSEVSKVKRIKRLVSSHHKKKQPALSRKPHRRASAPVCQIIPSSLPVAAQTETEAEDGKSATKLTWFYRASTCRLALLRQPLQSIKKSNQITDARADNRLGIWGGGAAACCGATVHVGCIVAPFLSP